MQHGALPATTRMATTVNFARAETLPAGCARASRTSPSLTLTRIRPVAGTEPARPWRISTTSLPRAVDTADNVCISGGGRIALTRLYAILGDAPGMSCLTTRPTRRGWELDLLRRRSSAGKGSIASTPLASARKCSNVIRGFILNSSNPTGKLLSGKHLMDGWTGARA